MKNKLFLGLASAMALITITATTAFAATNLTGTMARIDSNTNEITYSTDEGKTWVEQAPEGLNPNAPAKAADEYLYKANEDGSFTVEEKSNEQVGTGVVARINCETNEVDYSTDFGNTWSKNVPDGLK